MAKKPKAESGEPRAEGQAVDTHVNSDELVRLGRYLAKRDRITRAAAVDRIRRFSGDDLEKLRSQELTARPAAAVP